ncbi:MAG TPA: DCC1-like thiol-disulfide oxidoreductase family protein [Bacteroidales bacterium]|nr:DCC1-like thiol-disulfide oxidoreductase family protein [Bacteroidales bacterium]
MKTINEKPVIIYDGDCALCQQAVRFLKTTDGPDGIHFISSSTEQSDDMLQVHRLSKDMTQRSVILIDKGRIYTKSTAVIKAMQRKQGIWRFAGILMIIPAFLRNLVYDFVADLRRKK